MKENFVIKTKFLAKSISKAGKSRFSTQTHPTPALGRVARRKPSFRRCASLFEPAPSSCSRSPQKNFAENCLNIRKFL